MSIHIGAQPGEVAETVLLPGDPLRAKWIAETFFEEAKQYNKTRGMNGYTGLFQGKKVSVQGSGMGVGSMLIYAHELINDFGVKQLIRVGSAGSYQKEIHVRDIVIAMAASTDASFNQLRFGAATYAPTADPELFRKAADIAEKHNLPVHFGNVLSSDTFYRDDPSDYKLWAKFGILCVEMETAPLYTIAAQHGVKALSILTISDSLVTGDMSTPTERETSFKEMVDIALALV